MMRPIILILGPTASGKTALAIDLANALQGGGECICADSMQVYKRMDIGTAKPSLQERAAAPHHLCDLLEPSEDGFTLDKWLTLAKEVIHDIRERGKWPIVVGGTNLYVQSLLFGMFDAPEIDPEKRAALELESNSALQERLQRLDPEAVARIHINDRRRMIRAIEICEETGQTMTSLQSQWSAPSPREDAIILGLSWPVKLINRRINKRVRTMMESGLFEEVSDLQGQMGIQAREALGYKQLLSHLEGECTLDEAVERIKILTRRYAKQQRTWLRRFKVLPYAHFFEMEYNSPQTVAKQVLTTLFA